jgi:hypothetical protein
VAAEDNGAGPPEVAPDAREKFLERQLARAQKGVHVARLRRADGRGSRFGQRVAVEDHDLLEKGRDGFRCC